VAGSCPAIASSPSICRASVAPSCATRRRDQAFDRVGGGAVTGHVLLAGDLIAELRMRGDGFEPELLSIVLGRSSEAGTAGRGCGRAP